MAPPVRRLRGTIEEMLKDIWPNGMVVDEQVMLQLLFVNGPMHRLRADDPTVILQRKIMSSGGAC